MQARRYQLLWSTPKWGRHSRLIGELGEVRRCDARLARSFPKEKPDPMLVVTIASEWALSWQSRWSIQKSDNKACQLQIKTSQIVSRLHWYDPGQGAAQEKSGNQCPAHSTTASSFRREQPLQMQSTPWHVSLLQAQCQNADVALQHHHGSQQTDRTGRPGHPDKTEDTGRKSRQRSWESDGAVQAERNGEDLLLEIQGLNRTGYWDRWPPQGQSKLLGASSNLLATCSGSGLVW